MALTVHRNTSNTNSLISPIASSTISLNKTSLGWGEQEPEAVEFFIRHLPLTLGYFSFPVAWGYRFRTTNLAAGFFRNLWRLMGRFPCMQDEANANRVLGLHLLEAEEYKAYQEVTLMPYSNFNTKD